MKQFFDMHKIKLVILLAVWGFFSGCKILFDSFGRPNGLEHKYPLFLLTISLIALYALPMIALIRYLAKRFDVSKSVVNLSWILGLTASLSFSDIGHTLIGRFWLEFVKAPQSFINNWGAAVSAPFAEEFGKGLVILLVLSILRQIDLKSALVSGMIVGLSFQMVEDCNFTFGDMFTEKLDGFVGILERIVQAGGAHWTFSLLFAIGIVALISKDSGMSKKQGLFWFSMSIFAHFLFNSPIHMGITTNSSHITVLLLTFNFCLALAAFRTIDKIEPSKKLV